MSRTLGLPSAILCLLLTGCRTSAPDKCVECGAVGTLLADQAAAWNRGDLEAFMQGYWRSDQLTFSAGGRTQRGFDATLAGYRRRYPTREAMGTLHFSELETRLLAPDAMLVLGRWQLDRGDDSIGGNFTLVLQRFGGAWKIIHDHTSVAENGSAADPE